MAGSIRVLFLAEAVTLAHLARPIALAQGLDSAHFEIDIACDSRYKRFLDDTPWQIHPLHSIDSQQFLQALAQGNPVYTPKTLREYVKEDIQLLEQIKPDVVIGDFRLSLSVSARLVGIPYATITNAYWSPFYSEQRFPLPVLPLTKRLPIPVAQRLFALARPLAFAFHCTPLNRVRKEHGLPSLGSDLRRVYTDADYVLYADLPELFPIEGLPSNHRYLGPILWSPPVQPPAWWESLPSDKPLIYLTLGSSGQAQLLPTVIEAVAQLPITVIAATAGARVEQTLPPNVHLADYLPGTEAAARANLVICNGGSPTSQQALASGVPVLGIAGNMDQFLNMGALVAAGAGKLMRADRLTQAGIKTTVSEILGNAMYAEAARNLARQFPHYIASSNLAVAIEQIVQSRATAQTNAQDREN